MRRFLYVAVALAAAAVAAPATASGPWDPLAPAGPQRVSIHFLPAVHGREVVVEPNIAVTPDVPTTVLIVNSSREVHTFTIPKLHVNVVVLPGTPAHPRTTKLRVNAPAAGVYAWYCELCPAVHHQGAMRGKVYALVAG